MRVETSCSYFPLWNRALEFAIVRTKSGLAVARGSDASVEQDVDRDLADRAAALLAYLVEKQEPPP